MQKRMTDNETKLAVMVALLTVVHSLAGLPHTHLNLHLNSLSFFSLVEGPTDCAQDQCNLENRMELPDWAVVARCIGALCSLYNGVKCLPVFLLLLSLREGA